MFNRKKVRGRESILPPTTVVFQKMCLLERRGNYDFFNTIISHISPENLVKIPQVVQKISRFSPSILAVFNNFSDFLTFPCHKENNDVNIQQMMLPTFLTFNLF